MIAIEKYVGNDKLAIVKNEFFRRVKKYIIKKSDVFSKSLRQNSILINGDLPKSREEAIELQKKYNQKDLNRLKKDAIKIYENFMECKNRKRGTDKNGYWLCKELGIDVCPYCNREYTFTVSSGRTGITRPTFDHFLPKSKYPLLALSFYNLIPSCSICNLRKAEKEYPFFPYSDSFHANMRFDIQEYGVDIFSNNNAEFEIKLNQKNTTELAEKAQRNAEMLRLNSIYSHHKDYAREIILKAAYYNESSLMLIRDAFGNEFDDEFMSQMYFGNYLDENGIMKRPLSKLTMDIIEQFSGHLCRN